MADIPYVDNRFIYQPDTGMILFQNKMLPPTKELMKRSKEQLDVSQKLNHWTSISNNDINKIRILYPMLDSNLFYDLLSNYDKNIFANELLEMSQDEKNFIDKNMIYFKQMSNYIKQNIQNPEKFIAQEMDLKLESLADEFFQFNHSIFLSEVENTKKHYSN